MELVSTTRWTSTCPPKARPSSPTKPDHPQPGAPVSALASSVVRRNYLSLFLGPSTKAKHREHGGTEGTQRSPQRKSISVCSLLLCVLCDSLTASVPPRTTAAVLPSRRPRPAIRTPHPARTPAHPATPVAAPSPPLPASVPPRQALPGCTPSHRPPARSGHRKTGTSNAQRSRVRPAPTAQRCTGLRTDRTPAPAGRVFLAVLVPNPASERTQSPLLPLHTAAGLRKAWSFPAASSRMPAVPPAGARLHVCRTGPRTAP